MSANFDAVASEYDASFTDTEIGKAQRNLVWRYLNHYLNESRFKILEINCGTGLDAEFFSIKGHDVIATDISSEMINVARQKRSSNIQFEVAAFQDLKSRFQGQTFDFIFSNFAGLNCVSKAELSYLQTDFASLLNPGGRFVGVFLGEYCWQERLYFKLKGQTEDVNRRLLAHDANLDDKSIQQTHCFSPAVLKEVFSAFKLVRQRPIGLLVPPSYFEAQLRHWPRFVQLLEFVESRVASSKMANRADHFLIEFEVTTN